MRSASRAARSSSRAAKRARSRGSRNTEAPRRRRTTPRGKPMPKRRSRKRSPSARLNPTPPPAEAAGSTTTSSESAAPAVEPGSPAELADVAQQVREELKPEQPAVEVHDRRTEGGPSAAAGGTIADELVDVAAEKLEDLEKPGQFERLVAQLTEEDLGDVIELGFGWVADTRGPHWEIGEKQSRR